ncbi:MAG TPA: hypothetical protein VHC19_20525 [Pirellulales bacterium]|nr:hypothetical protein [Pirellulales bacterium]
MSWAIRSSPFRAGDTIAYSKRFLQSIGCHIGGMASARGKVTAIERDGDAIYARIDWDAPGLPERLDIKNLSLVKNGMVMEHG